MNAANVDMWLIFDREPVIDPLTQVIGGTVGDGNVYAFWRDGERLGAAAMLSHGVRQGLLKEIFGDRVTLFAYKDERYVPHLRALLAEVDPLRIAINASPDFPLADGITAEMLGKLRAAAEGYADRFVSSAELVSEFVLVRTELETAAYRDLCGWTIDLMRLALSADVIQAGKTTAEDVHWWALEAMQSMGLESFWPGPGLRVTRAGAHHPVNEPDVPLEVGDVLNLDLGLVHLGFHSDLKRNAVLLGSSLRAPVPGLIAAYDKAIEMREVLTRAMRPGRIGHVVWQEVMEWGRSQGFGQGGPVAGGTISTISHSELAVYGHSVGAAVHDSGARTGPPKPGWGPRVNLPLQTNAWYALEFHVSLPVPEWGERAVKVAMEEAIVLRDDGPEYLVEPQDRWWTVL
jgi:Xaa-Pro aminopeptidase